MLIRPILEIELEQARALLSANGWARRVEDPARFSALIANSQLALVAVDDRQVVGFLRAVTDHISNGYLSMVVVAESHRRRGIGTALVRTAMGTDERITWVLRAGREGVRAFYEALGFTQSTAAMERRGMRG
jgi:ribosomal protein S18 acetylase RimI-like enzyme